MFARGIRMRFLSFCCMCVCYIYLFLRDLSFFSLLRIVFPFVFHRAHYYCVLIHAQGPFPLSCAFFPLHFSLIHSFPRSVSLTGSWCLPISLFLRDWLPVLSTREERRSLHVARAKYVCFIFLPHLIRALTISACIRFLHGECFFVAAATADDVVVVVGRAEEKKSASDF